MGSCERCNYVKEAAGWRVSAEVDESGRHAAEFTTPTGQRYRSVAPPRAPAVTVSELEVRVGIALLKHVA